MSVTVQAERWAIIGFGLIVAIAVMAVGPATPARAQSLGPSIAQAGQRSFDIPAQPLNEALVEFGRQAGMSASADTTLTRNRRSTPVKGVMSWQQALSELLAGSGLAYRVNGSIVTLEGPGQATGALQLDPVQVQGVIPPATAMIGTLPPPFAGGQVATGGQVGILGNKDLMNTPFSTTAYTDRLMRDQQARTLQDVFANDPTVRATAQRFTFANSFNIRGFNINGLDMTFDGLQGLTANRREFLANVERVEIQRGPTGMLNNMPAFGSIGGQVNLVPKRASAEPLTRVTAGYMNTATFGGTADVGRRFGEGDQFGARLNASFYGGNTPIDRQSMDDLELAGGFDWRGDRARVTFDLGYKESHWKAQSGLFLAAPTIAIPVAPYGTTNVRQSWEYFDSYYAFGSLRGEFDILPNLTAFAAYGRSRNQEKFFASTPTITSVTGNFTATVQSTVLNSISAEVAEVGLRGKFSTGPISHSVAVAASGYWRENFSNPRANVGTPIVSNIFNPVAVSAPNGNIFAGGFQNRTATSDFASIGVAETMSVFDERLQFLLGGRLQRMYTQSFGVTSGLLTAAYEASAFSPSVALLGKPMPGLSVYASWIQGLTPGPVAPATAANAGQAFPAIVSQQYEIGAKLELEKFGATLSLFQITQPQSFIAPFTNIFGVDGLQRNSGAELTMFGELAEGVRLLGGATLMEGVQVQTQGGLNDGRAAAGVPNVLVNLGAEWDLPWVRGLTLTGRTIYTSGQFLNQMNTQSIPAWIRFDVGARYTTEIGNKPLTFRANIDNVFNNNYWQSASFGSLTQGQPLTLMLSISRDF